MPMVLCKAYAAAELGQSEMRMCPTGLATNKHCREEQSDFLNKAQPPCSANTYNCSIMEGVRDGIRVAY